MQSSKKIKACLDVLLSKCDSVFIIPHIYPDYDAIGASIGIDLICKKMKIDAYTVINDCPDPIVKKIINNSELTVIKSDDIDNYKTEHSLLLIVDCNKIELVPVKDKLDEFDESLIIDHHKVGETTIKAKHSFIDERLSSTCEEIARLLKLYGVKDYEKYANVLYAGIVLDTNRFVRNVTDKTHKSAANLVKAGADTEEVSKFFLDKFPNDRLMQKLIDNTIFLGEYAIAFQKDLDDIYTKIEIAKAADYLLRFDIEATFALAYNDKGHVCLHSRSKDTIDVDKIMKEFGGGGTELSAACEITGSSINEVMDLLMYYLQNKTYTIEDKLTLKRKKN